MTTPNIVLIVTDDQTFESIYQMGEAVFPLLVSKGTTFLNSYTVSPQCSPSRASLQSGQYTHNHGLWTNQSAAPQDWDHIDKATLFPVALQQAGYLTGHFGKFINDQTTLPVPTGWNKWWTILGGGAFQNYDVSAQGTAVHYDDELSTTLIAEMAAIWIRNKVAYGQKFFAQVGFFAPHAPYTAAAGDVGKAGQTIAPRVPGWNEVDPSKPAYIRDLPDYDGLPDTEARIDQDYRAYLDCLHSLDAAIKTVIEALGTEIESTVIILTTDHGVMRGQHRVPHAKSVPYDPALRVPLVMRGPGIPANWTCPALVGNIDVTASILDWADASPLRPLDGVSLLPLFDGSVPEVRDALLIEFLTAKTYGWIPGAPGPAYIVPAYSGVLTRERSYTKYETGETELYNLTADPYELRSLHADPAHAATLAAMEAVRVGLGAPS